MKRTLMILATLLVELSASCGDSPAGPSDGPPERGGERFDMGSGGGTFKLFEGKQTR
ncbi:hypothetical protein BH23GEM3_BH23GEM3_04070 [soil metagenome]